MTRPEAQKPQLIKEDDVMGKEYSHPAFGIIGVSRQQGGDRTLFGSALRHNNSICIRLHSATMHRSLAHDWYHARKLVAEVVLSESQWATFVSSMNMGDGVPCTFQNKPDENSLEWIPSIVMESQHETHVNELKESGRELVERLEGISKRIDELANGSGTIKKTELRELSKELSRATGGVVSGMAFHVDQHKEAMEKNVHAAKSDVEGYVTGLVLKLGVESLKDLAPRLEDKRDVTE